MLNSDQDLNANPNRRLARSSSLQYPPIATELSIEQSKSIPIFTEATAQSILLAEAPVSIATVVAGSSYQIAAVSGLENFLSLSPNPDLSLEFAGLEYCHAQVFNSGNSLCVPNCQQSPQLAQSSLCQRHGIQAYLGVPIITTTRDILGTLAILDFKPRQFSDREIELLQLVSRLVASEFERKVLSQLQLNRWVTELQSHSPLGFDDSLAADEYRAPTAQMTGDSSPKDMLSLDIGSEQLSSHTETISTLTDGTSALLVDKISYDYPQIQSEIQYKLLAHLAQELRTPLTSVVGMASVLQQEIYGALSSKQRDYLGIIHHSGQQLVALVDEMSQLGEFNRQQHQLSLNSVDIEMLCQLAIQNLEPLAQKKCQQLSLVASDNANLERLTVARWVLDKDKVRQIVYYLCLSLISASDNNRQISIEFVTLTDRLQLTFSSNDSNLSVCHLFPLDDLNSIETTNPAASILAETGFVTVAPASCAQETLKQDLRISLGLSLSHHLAALHGGKIEVIANDRGYRLTLPLNVAVN